MLTWSIDSKEFHLKYTWKISRNSSDTKTNLFVTVNGEGNEGRGEAAPNIRYGETPEVLMEEFEKLRSILPADEIPVEEFNSILDSAQVHNALRFAIESAYIHWICRKRNIPVWEYFGLPEPKPVHTSFSMPIMPLSEVEDFVRINDLQRFKYIKIKIGRDEAVETLDLLSQILPQNFIVDGNECFQNPDEVLSFLSAVDASRIEILEQPMPAGLSREYSVLKPLVSVPVFADESMTDNLNISELSKGFHGVNMKLMKAGGYLRGLQQLKEAKKFGLKTMIGCMVESTLGISSAFNLTSMCDYADLDGFMIIKDEPFELIQESNGVLKLA